MNTSLAGKKITKDSITNNFDFFDYDLRGTVFSDVHLVGCKFCGALLGRTLVTTRWLVILQSLLLTAASYFVVYGNAFAAWFIEVQLKAFGVFSGFNLFFILVVYALCFVIAAYFSLKNKNWSLPIFFTIVLIIAALLAIAAGNKEDTTRTNVVPKSTVVKNSIYDDGVKNKTGDKVGAGARAVDGPAAIAGALVGAGLGSILVLVVVATIVAGSGTDANIRAIFTVVSIAGAGIAIWGFTGAIGDSIAKAGFQEQDSPRVIANIIAWAGAGAGLVFMLFGWYLGRRASKNEEPGFLFLHHFGVGLNALGATTEFAKAILQDCNFSGVDLKHVRFKNANFQGCKFQDVVNAHLALTLSTPLELKKVRELVINRILLDKNLAGLNLQGLDFSYSYDGALRNTSFANANINFANFTGCDLSNADLSEATALGTCFNNCILTGAYLEHWNIDSRTNIENVICDFIYTKKNPKERRPLNGKFKAGDFTKTYKQVADTIDFLISSQDELAVLIRSVEIANINAGGEKIVVQAIEYKEDGSVVLKVKSSPELDRKKVFIYINKIKNLQKKLIKKESDIKKLEIKKNNIFENIGSVAHELNPINSTLNDGLTAILKNDVDHAKAAIKLAIEKSRSGLNIFEDMRKKLNSDFGYIEYSNFDVRLLVQEVVNEKISYANQKNVKIHLSNINNFKSIINSDRYYLKLILSNIVDNSIKYSDPSKSDLATIVIAIVSNANTIRIDIIDNGIGIPIDKQNKIWEDGFRVCNSGKDIDGTGFGLFFVRNKIDELIDHEIKLKCSKEGTGTRFSLKLPKLVDEAKSDDLNYPLDGLYVLLVESNNSAKKSRGTLLEANGAKYKVVNSMEELRTLLPNLERYPDVVITDYQLPNNYCTARDVIFELKKEFPHEIPTLIIADEYTDLDDELNVMRNPLEEELVAEINFLGWAEEE